MLILLRGDRAGGAVNAIAPPIFLEIGEKWHLAPPIFLDQKGKYHIRKPLAPAIFYTFRRP